MNEKIEELIEQAWTYQVRVFNEPDGTRTFSEKEKVFDKEKFAGLIVQECTSIADGLVNRSTDGTWTSNELYTDYNGALFEVKRRIEEHFGVE